MSTWLATGLLALSMAAEAQAQIRDQPGPRPAPTGTAILGGIVTSDGPDPRPIRRVIVTLSGTAGGSQTVTDDGGRFAFANLPAGRYTLTAEKPAYLKTFYGSRATGRGPGTPIALADGQQVATVAMRLVRGAVIAGLVLDDNGNPISSAQVTAYRSAVVDGERRLIEVRGELPWATTDDRGAYRLFGFPPGEYTVRVAANLRLGPVGVRLTTPADVDAAMRELQSPAGARPPAGRTSAPVVAPEAPFVQRSVAYFPSAADATSAQFVTVATGEERNGVDVRVPLVRSAKVAGTMVGPGGRPLLNVMVGLANVSTGSLWASPGFVRPDADGRFVLPPMTAGRYVFFGQGADGAADDGNPTVVRPYWTDTEFTVIDQDVSGLVVQFRPGSSVTGRLMMNAVGSLPDLTAVRVGLTPLPRISGSLIAPPRQPLQPDGTFTFRGVAPGRYRVVLTGLTGWTLAAARFQGRDTLDTPLVVESGQDVSDLTLTITDRPTSITGTLFDQLGRPTPEFAVIVFSTDRAHWTSAPRRTSGLVKLGPDGTFAVKGLPPGEYYLVAVTDVEPAQLTDPAVLELLASGGIRVVLAEGEKKIQDIRLGG